MTIQVETQIDTFLVYEGTSDEKTMYSVWFWIGTNCEHVGYFDSSYDAECAARSAMGIHKLTIDAARDVLAQTFTGAK